MHARTHARSAYARTHARTHAHTHARTHAHGLSLGGDSLVQFFKFAAMFSFGASGVYFSIFGEFIEPSKIKWSKL